MSLMPATKDTANLLPLYVIIPFKFKFDESRSINSHWILGILSVGCQMWTAQPSTAINAEIVCQPVTLGTIPSASGTFELFSDWINSGNQYSCASVHSFVYRNFQAI
mmetsp:Transcript_13481/g.19333  ORF Transcript_13481/g.19333 Transcript_13481/m.19333 type:complete len:107 (+) Transcript_13481:160-480(+)